MRVIGYARVSTEEQASEGVSLDAQQSRIEAYCIAKSWELIGIEVDRGYSAKDTNRPGVQAVLNAVKSGDVEAIIIYKLDRLTRSVLDLNNIVMLLDKKDVALVSMEKSLDATTPTGRLMLNLLASVSQWEREIIGQRTKDACSISKSNGRRIAGLFMASTVLHKESLLRTTQRQRSLSTCGSSSARVCHICRILTLST